MQAILPDIHLGAAYDGCDRTEDIKKNLLWIRTKILENDKIDSILFLGDIFDSPNVSYSVVSWFITYLKGFTCTGNHYFYILKGNHDGEINSRKGSPLQDVEASGLARIFWEPEVCGRQLFLPYTSQEKLDEFCKVLPEGLKYCYTHLDIPGTIPGIEKQISRGLSYVIPRKVLDYPGIQIFSGHVHRPQKVAHVHIIGSLIVSDISERDDQKQWVIHDDFGTGNIDVNLLDNRKILSCKLNLSLEKDIMLYKALLTDSMEGDVSIKDAIVSLEMIIPHNIAHTIDQVKFKDVLRSKCYHLKEDIKIVKEKQFRMKELDKTLSDEETIKVYLDKQDVSDKDQILQDVKGILK